MVKIDGKRMNYERLNTELKNQLKIDGWIFSEICWSDVFYIHFPCYLTNHNHNLPLLVIIYKIDEILWRFLWNSSKFSKNHSFYKDFFPKFKKTDELAILLFLNFGYYSFFQETLSFILKVISFLLSQNLIIFEINSHFLGHLFYFE